MTLTRHLSDKFRSTPQDKYICQRAKNAELNIKLILYDDIIRRNQYKFEFLLVEPSLSKIYEKNYLTTIHPLIDTFVT